MTGASTSGAEVPAAGGVVWRRGADGVPRVAVVHRPRHDDWSLPKGKLDPGENFEAAAVREVREEIGAEVRTGRELTPARYTDDEGRSKLVRYWLMEATDVRFVPNDEVDELRWLAPGEAVARLTYERDRELVAEAGL